MQITRPSDCGKAPGIAIVGEFAAKWAAGEATAVAEWLTDDASWSLIGAGTHSGPEAAEQVLGGLRQLGAYTFQILRGRGVDQRPDGLVCVFLVLPVVLVPLAGEVCFDEVGVVVEDEGGVLRRGGGRRRRGRLYGQRDP